MPRRASIAIHLLLAVLLVPPLHYYLFNQDKRDERFAWRMFSPVRVERCGTQFFLGPERKLIKASAYFHNAWVGVAQRGRQQVIRAMAEKLCKDNPETELRVRIQCERRPGVAQSNPRALYDQRRSESDEDIELIARGSFDFCSTEAL